MSNIADKSGSPVTKPKKFRPKGPDSSERAFIVLVALALGMIPLSPQISRALAHLGPATEQVLLGKVVKVTFLRGMGHATQVDTEKESVLLSGAVSLAAGTPLERRRHWWDLEVCDLRSGDCWELVSR